MACAPGTYMLSIRLRLKIADIVLPGEVKTHNRYFKLSFFVKVKDKVHVMN